MSTFTKVTLVYTVNATGVCTSTQMATDLATAWAALDKSLVLTLYGCTITSAVATHPSATQAVLTVVIALSAAFLAAFPAVDATGDTSPFVNLFTAQLRAAVVQPIVAAAPVYGAG